MINKSSHICYAERWQKKNAMPSYTSKEAKWLQEQYPIISSIFSRPYYSHKNIWLRRLKINCVLPMSSSPGSGLLIALAEETKSYKASKVREILSENLSPS